MSGAGRVGSATDSSAALTVPAGEGAVYGLFVPNAPNLIAPEQFGGAGSATVAALRDLRVPDRVGPDVVLVSTPHFSTPGHFVVQVSARPRCLHDFGGFPGLQRFRYEPPGDPELGHRLAEAGACAGLPVTTTTGWGLDHGAWAPLLHLFPRADVPVVPLSISDRSPDEHRSWGEVIGRTLRSAGRRAVIVGTGSILHRLDRVRLDQSGEWNEGAELEQQVVEATLTGGAAALGSFDAAKWRTLAPEGGLAPLFTVLGAMGPDCRGRRVVGGQVFGAAGMTVLEFSPRGA